MAVEWAIREVAARGSSLRIGSSELPTCFQRGSGELHRQRLVRLVRDLRDEHASLVVDLITTQGDTRQVLIDDAATPDLLVLASSNGESTEALLLGSLARTAVRRSPCPVVVVRGNAGPVRHIVVGVDGSSPAHTALEWACAEANLHHADLLVIHSREGDISRAEAGCILDLAVSECRELTGVPVRGVLSDEPPASALIAASRKADVVTVGSRGRSGFKTAVFGSVALAIASSAHCPVAVTHPMPKRD
jgi:nucleotide-binding universal stress UspA family protein